MSAINHQVIIQDPVLVTLRASLCEALKNRLSEIWLFGSRARGDSNRESDYDILVIADGDLPGLRAKVSESGYQILDQYEELVGSIVYTPDQWEKSKRGPLAKNVLEHGIRLYSRETDLDVTQQMTNRPGTSDAY